MKQFANEKFQVDCFLGVGVCDFFKQFANGNFNSKFFTDFTNETLFESFICFAFAARKFPKSAKVRVCVALGD